MLPASNKSHKPCEAVLVTGKNFSTLVWPLPFVPVAHLIAKAG
jgi:hypothetical protein